MIFEDQAGIDYEMLDVRDILIVGNSVAKVGSITLRDFL